MANEALAAKQSITKLKDCRYGKMLYLRCDEYVGKSLDTYGEFSEGEAEVFQALVRPRDVVIEVGANIGAHTVHLAQLVGSEGLVLALEPQRGLYHILCANIALNDLFNVHTYLAAAGEKEGLLKVPPIDYTAEGNFGGVSLGNGEGGEAVAVTTLDSFTLPYLRLIKVDVEGMEAKVLLGARNLIAQHRPFLYVENDREEKSEELIGLIESFGYDAWWHQPPLFNQNNFDQKDDNIFGHATSINLLCAPKEMKATFDKLKKVSGPKDSPAI